MHDIIEPRYKILGQQMTMPNVITLLRLPLLVVVVLLICYPGPVKSSAAFVLLVSLFLMDWLDGYVARRRNETTNLGSILDIAVDRAVENILWLTFIAIGLAPLFVGIIFLIRSFLVDGLRSWAQSKKKNAFALMTSGWGKFLVVSRFMRAFYGLAKAFAFGSLIIFQLISSFGQAMPPFYFDAVWSIALASVYLSALLCVIRGIPVLTDSLILLRQ